MPGFLLVGHAGFYNRGFAAIVRSTVGLLRQRRPECSVTVASSSSEQDKPHSAADGLQVIRQLVGAQRFSRIWFRRKIVRLLANVPHAGPTPTHPAVRKAMAKVDVVLSIGGDNHSADHGRPRRLRSLYPCRSAHRQWGCGRPRGRALRPVPSGSHGAPNDRWSDHRGTRSDLRRQLRQQGHRTHSTHIPASRPAAGLCMAIPIGLVSGLSEPLLVLWLGEEFRSAATLLLLLVAHLAVNVSVAPLFGINQAANRVRLPTLVQVGMGVVSAVLAITLARVSGWGMYGVAAAGAIVLTTKNAVFTPAYAAYVPRRPLTTLSRAMLLAVALTAALAAGLRALSGWVVVASLSTLVAVALASCIFSVALILLLGRGARDARSARPQA